MATPQKEKYTPKKRSAAKAVGRYPGQIEIGVVQGLIAGMNEAGLELISGMIDQRKIRLQALGTGPMTTAGTKVSEDDQSTPKAGKPVKEHVWERPIIKRLGYIVEWGKLTPAQRTEDKLLTSLASSLTGTVKRLKEAENPALTEDEIYDICIIIGRDVPVAKAITMERLNDKRYNTSLFSDESKAVWTALQKHVSGLKKAAKTGKEAPVRYGEPSSSTAPPALKSTKRARTGRGVKFVAPVVDGSDEPMTTRGRQSLEGPGGPNPDDDAEDSAA